MSRRAWTVVATLLCAALVTTTVGWVRASEAISLDEEAPSRFETCTLDGGRLTLTYSYGVNDSVAPRVDLREDDRIVVELLTAREDGPDIAMALGGRAEFDVYGADEDTVVEYADGTPLRCD